MNTDASNVEDINTHQIIERLSMSCIESSGERFNIFRNRSFTLFKNERDFRERFDSATVSESISSSMTNLSYTGLAVLVFDISACDLRAPHAFETHPGAITFPPEVSSQRRSSNGPIRFPQHLFSDRDHERQRSGRGPQPLSCPYVGSDCTLSRLRAGEYDRPVTQSIATPEPSSRTISTLDRTLVARWSLECVTTLGSRWSCPG